MLNLTEKIMKLEQGGTGESLEKKIEEVVARKLSEVQEERGEREKRKDNIILVNVPESTGEDNEDRKKEDIEKTKEIIRKACPDIPTDISVTEPVRLGKPEKDKTRLLRVKVDSEETKRKILKNAYSLNTGIKDPKKRIYINPDYTPSERKQQKDLRDELRKRREGGETDIIIRNSRIVKKTPNPDMPQDS